MSRLAAATAPQMDTATQCAIDQREATVIDLSSRRLAGWAIADHTRADLVIDALHLAERTRGSPAEPFHVAITGPAQCCSRTFGHACREPDVAQSTNAADSSADDALPESSTATGWRETLQGRGPGTPGERHIRTSSASCTATAPSDAIPASDIAARSPPSPLRTTEPPSLDRLEDSLLADWMPRLHRRYEREAPNTGLPSSQ